MQRWDSHCVNMVVMVVFVKFYLAVLCWKGRNIILLKLCAHHHPCSYTYVHEEEGLLCHYGVVSGCINCFYNSHLIAQSIKVAWT